MDCAWCTNPQPLAVLVDLEQLILHAKDLQDADVYRVQYQTMKDQRQLLDEPDLIAPCCQASCSACATNSTPCNSNGISNGQ